MEKREIKFKYICKRHNGFTFEQIFTLEEIQNGGASLWIERNIISENELTKLEFTGLKDKNGKEIYDRDILGGYPHGTAEVRWNNEGYWEAHWIEQQIDEDGAEFDVDCTALFANELDNCKDEWTVIGNMFEHPHLLTDKQ